MTPTYLVLLLMFPLKCCDGMCAFNSNEKLGVSCIHRYNFLDRHYMEFSKNSPLASSIKNLRFSTKPPTKHFTLVATVVAI